MNGIIEIYFFKGVAQIFLSEGFFRNLFKGKNISIKVFIQIFL